MTTSALRDALKKLMLAYVSTLETGRNRIIDLGGTCDPVDVMEKGDPALQAARTALSASEAEMTGVEGLRSHE